METTNVISIFGEQPVTQSEIDRFADWFHRISDSDRERVRAIVSGPRKHDRVKFSDIKAVLRHLSDETGTVFRHSTPNRGRTKHCEFVRNLLAKGYTVEHCRMVIDLKSQEWGGDEKFRRFLRPQTLFQASKFDQYLDEALAR